MTTLTRSVNTPAGIAADEPIRHVRSTVDGIRCGAGVLLILGGAIVANIFDSSFLGLADDTAATVGHLPDWTRDVAAAGLASVVICGTIAVAIWSLATTRYRRFMLFVAGIVLAFTASMLVGQAVYDYVDPAVRRAFEIEIPLFRIAGADNRLSPADPLLAAAVATLTIGGSFLPRKLVRKAALLVGVYAVGSVLTIAAPPLTLFTDLGAGLLAGSVLLWIFGRHDLALRPQQIQLGLASAGLEIDYLANAPGTSREGWLATQYRHGELFVVAFSRDDRSADLFTRSYQWLRLRKTGDHRPFLSLRRSVEHEALVSQQASNRGVNTPKVRAVAPAGIDGMVLARDWIDGTNASTLTELSVGHLTSLWEIANRLHQAKIAHGALNLENFVIGPDNLPRIVNFQRGELAASEQRLGTDLAELLASTAGAVGIDQAVLVAFETVGATVLQRAVPWLQPLALTSATRTSIGGSGGLVRLREAATQICGREPEELVRLERVNSKGLFVLATIVLSGWFLIPQLTDFDSLWSQAQGASWQWAALAAVFSMCTYMAATGSLLGAIPTRLRYWPALTAQIASSFANRVTPAKVGGVATNLRYFQNKGVPTAVGVTAIGLNAIAGLIMHVVLTLSFLLLASGETRSEGLSVPDTGTILLGFGALAGTIAAAVAISSTRRLIATYVLPQLKSGWESLSVIAQDPVRILLLFGGSAAITLLYLAAMVSSLEAFGATASLPLIGLLFLTGSAVANAAPTPGGLGAVEAALIASLSTVEEAAVVVPAVFLYRLVTFWLPIIPGWIALTYLRQSNSL